MGNKKYDEIIIPTNIDSVIKKGVEKALIHKKCNTDNKYRKLSKVLAASFIGLIIVGIVNPVLASKIPFVGNVFEVIEKNIYFPGNYSQYATSINETAYSNGIGITLSELVCDGQTLYATYIVENDEPFKNTSWGNGKELDMNQLEVEAEYNQLDFTNEEPDVSGFSGLEGEFIDENTFVGVETYDLSNIEEDIPDEFIFKTKLVSIENYATEENSKDYVKKGTWAFNVPVKVNKSLKKEIITDNLENDIVKVKSVVITPFKSIVKVEYKKGNWDDYDIKVLDENNKKLYCEQTSVSEDNDKEISASLEATGNSKSIRIVIEKPVYKELKSQKGTYEEVRRDLVFDEVLYLDK